MEASGQFHSPAPIGQEAERAPGRGGAEKRISAAGSPAVA
jgi:hypothetical protein